MTRSEPDLSALACCTSLLVPRCRSVDGGLAVRRGVGHRSSRWRF